MIRTRNKNKKGFTLGEMVTTVAIIGTLSAVAVPNYLRIKMEVNMETVRQELKKIQVHMNDLLNRDRQFPQDINNLGNSDEEQSITASLTAIDLKEYTTDGYQIDANFSNYQIRSCPRRRGAGDKCFTLNPMQIMSAALPADFFSGNPWSGSLVPMPPISPAPTPWTHSQWLMTKSGGDIWTRDVYRRNFWMDPFMMVDSLLSSKNLSEDDRINLMTAYLETLAYENFKDATFPDYSWYKRKQTNEELTTNVFPVSEKYKSELDKIMPSVYKNLKEAGLEIFVSDRDSGYSSNTTGFGSFSGTLKLENQYRQDLLSNEKSRILQVGFKADASQIPASRLEKLTNPATQPDYVKFYYAAKDADYKFRSALTETVERVGMIKYQTYDYDRKESQSMVNAIAAAEREAQSLGLDPIVKDYIAPPKRYQE
jgi:prepilin-type N-terminal cleavage/methylation domain-containing protein